jgi:hypothetical protein
MSVQPDDSATLYTVAILEGHRIGSVLPGMAFLDDVDPGDRPVILGHSRPNEIVWCRSCLHVDHLDS